MRDDQPGIHTTRDDWARAILAALVVILINAIWSCSCN